jgi:hypothetical protein
VSGPIDEYLAELAHRLRRVPSVSERVIEESRAHLEESAAAGQARGLDAADAEAEAVARFGSARALAHGLAPARRRRGRRTLAIALALSMFGGLAIADVAGPPELVGLVRAPDGSRSLASPPLSGYGQSRLVSLDPLTLAPVGTPVGVPPGPWVHYQSLPPAVALHAPDGKQLGVVMNGAVTLYALRPLQRETAVRFAPATPTRGPRRPNQRAGSLDPVQAAAWLAGGGIAVLIQYQASPYARRVTSRTLVIIDAGTKRVLSRTRLQLRGPIIAFASAADRIVVLACRDGATRLLVGDANATTSSLSTDLPCRVGRAAVAVRTDGSEAAIVADNGSISIVDLAARPLQLRRLPAALARKRAANTASSVTWVGTSLAITATTEATALGRRESYLRGRGVVLVDPQRATRRVLTPHGSRLLVAGNALIVSGYDDSRPGGTAIGDGVGVTAYAPDGTRLWHADGARIVRPYAIGQRVYAPRMVKHDTVVDVFDLQTGRALAHLHQNGLGVVPLTGAIESIGT